MTYIFVIKAPSLQKLPPGDVIAGHTSSISPFGSLSVSSLENVDGITGTLLMPPLSDPDVLIYAVI